MRGSLREKRPGYYELRVSAADPATGRTKQISRGFKGNRREAERALRKLAGEVDRGKSAAKPDTLAVHLERWKKVAWPNMSPTTTYDWDGKLRRYVLPALGDRRLDKITTLDLDLLFASLVADNGLSPATVRHVKTILRLAFRQAVRWRLVEVNPVIDATLPAQRKPNVAPPTPEEVQLLIRTADEQKNYELAMLVWIAAATGARRAELCALRWSSIDFVTGAIEISESVTAAGGYIIHKDTKTHIARRVMIDPGTLAVFDAYRRRIQERGEQAGLVVGPDAYVFSLALDGSRPWHPDKISQAFIRLRNDAGVKCRFHDLRHFQGTYLEEDGSIPMSVISRRLGHARQSTTTDMYLHAREVRDVDAAAVIGRLLTPPNP